ncbi:hypothetical protein BFP70_13015 [Thioclava sp. SK-1]|uniref:putative quinol monooxygenase n=1 Tax=Thioclava sp. SK-1 TaxID=1889770 RepID=UPI000824D526|nr:antibiotic biosynthesis monooxygenase [Thioclava sp. SK-1]OCX63124.1 hypothetical protein BFP70_13015 [Thioclava sp. SK-1]
MPVHLSGILICQTKEDAARVRVMLPDHIRATLAEPGCLMFEVTQMPDAPLQFRVTESFLDEASFQAHQQRTHNSPWGQSTAHMERRYHITQSDVLV